MAQCKYQYEEYKCPRRVLPDSPKSYCILHEDWERKDNQETKKAFYKEIEGGKTDFTGCVLPEINLTNRTIEGRAVFRGATIKGSAYFKEVTIKRSVYFDNAIIEGGVLFDGAKMEKAASFTGVKIKEDAFFVGVTIKGNAYFYGATIEGDALFDQATIGAALLQEATIEEDARLIGLAKILVVKFDGTRIRGNVSFFKATIKGFVSFQEATIEKNAYFDGVKIEGAAYFNGATIKEFTSFKKAKIERDVSFDKAKIEGAASFDKATIGGSTSFPFSKIDSVTFKDTKFEKMPAQEVACRTARRIQEERGNRIEADYYFYREMEAKRKRKKWYKRYILELPVQYIFGYGVKPERVILTWFATVFILAFLYWIGDGIELEYPHMEYIYLSLLTGSPFESIYLNLLTPANPLDCLYFSIATAATPGYGGYYPKPAILGLPTYQILAIAEAIFGTFMWAAFIATFARKFMRA